MTIECKHEKWSNDPDCECTVNHCIYCDATEVSIHAEVMEELCAKQEAEIAGLEVKLAKYDKALGEIQYLDCAKGCSCRYHGIENGPCDCHRSVAEKALT